LVQLTTFDRPFGDDLQIVQGANHFQAGEYPVDAVELATRRLRITVGTREHRRQVFLAPGTAGKDIAHGIDPHRAARGFGPGYKQVATTPVLFRQGQPRNAALGRGADLRHLHQRGPQALAIDPRQGAHERGSWGLAR
jgi:hypothetical protein